MAITSIVDTSLSEDTRFMPRKKFGRNRKNRCRFCTPEGCPRPAYVDYKDVGLLKKLCTNQSKMFSRKRSGNCAAFQRASSDAIKRARFMALVPYVGE
jgi:small subunit ribosomal protein S18